MFYVYILTSQSRAFHYVGLTRNLHRRFMQHHQGQTPITKGYRPLQLTWFCAFPDRFRAGRFELYLKSGSGRAFSQKHLLN